MSLKVDKKRILLSVTAILAFIKTSSDTLPTTSIIAQIMNIIGSIDYNKKCAFEALEIRITDELTNLFDYLSIRQCNRIVAECFSPHIIEKYIIGEYSTKFLADKLKENILNQTKHDNRFDLDFIENAENYEEKANTLLVKINKAISENDILRDFEHKITGTQTLSLVTGINAQLQQVFEQISKPNSAYLWHMPPRNSVDREIFRFHYSAGNVHLQDRNHQLCRLKEFCGYNTDMERIQYAPDFQWWMITGKGGTGKSRLAYEFSNIMQIYDWTICYPFNNTYSTLKQCSEALPNDTLFILDYTEMGLTDIGEWLVSLGVNKYTNVRIRVLLIQRFAANLESLNLSKNSHDKAFIKNTMYNNGEFMKLETISDESLKSLMREYTNFTIDTAECDLLFDLLCGVDKLKRPLFALACADAYIDGEKICEKYKLLDHICNKESDYIKDKILRTFTTATDELICIAQNIFTMATMVGRINLGTALKILLPDDYSELQKLYYEHRKRFLMKTGLFYCYSDNIYCEPIEPDIIGEYYVLRNIAGKEELINYAWGVPYYMSRFVTRLYQDFEEKLSDFKEYIDHPQIPKYITDLESDAFSGCKNLISIELHENIRSIGSFAFSECNNLTTIKIPEGVTHIGASAFQNCTNLESVEISDSVVKIGNGIFSNCSNLKKVKLSNNLTTVPLQAFYNCISLNTIDIPISVTSIDDAAFSNCISLMIENLPISVCEIKRAAFSDCKSLKTVTIPGKVTTLSDYAFSGCTCLETIILPNTVKKIGEYAFLDCHNLSIIELPYHLEFIEKSAFVRCYKLDIHKIPTSVKHIAFGAFAECGTPQLFHLLKTYCSKANVRIEPILTLEGYLRLAKKNSKSYVGTVIWYKNNMGYGFINIPNLGDYFVHFSQILYDENNYLDNEFKSLNVGQKVLLDIEYDSKNPKLSRATNVLKI